MIQSWRNSGIRLERNVAPKIQNYVETIFPIFIKCLYSDSWITSMKMRDKDRQRHEKGEELAANI